jgi:hypothetical protein
MRTMFHTTQPAANAKVRRPGAGLALAALALTAAPLHAQTTGAIPVWVDPPTQTLGDSPLIQCGDGSSVCIGPGKSPAQPSRFRAVFLARELQARGDNQTIDLSELVPLFTVQ